MPRRPDYRSPVVPGEVYRDGSGNVRIVMEITDSAVMFTDNMGRKRHNIHHEFSIWLNTVAKERLWPIT